METTKIEGIKCPKCGNEQVICQKRGYSPLLGIIGAIGTFIIVCAVWMYSSGYLDRSSFDQFIMLLGNKLDLFFFGILGLLWGMVGQNKLVYQCVSCGKRFTKSDLDGTTQARWNTVLFVSIGIVLVLALLLMVASM